MSYNNIENWKPYQKTEEILNRAMEHIKSVNYSVSLRWVFYRLLQDSLYSKKSDYASFAGLTSRARRAYWNGWNPLTLSDETRSMIEYNYRGDKPIEIDESLLDEVLEETESEYEYLKDRIDNFSCEYHYSVDSNYMQNNFIVIAFEARAMTQQFREYTNGLTLIPCGGQPSIPLRYLTSEYINEKTELYNIPAMVLYFGDYDSAGLDIFNSFKEDLEEWCNDATIIHCGLNIEQIEMFKNEGKPIPENPEKKGQYQWEALTDEQARRIIETSIFEYFNKDAYSEALKLSNYITSKVRNYVNERLDLS